MGRRSILDDIDAYRSAWAALAMAERRRIIRAVNRGTTLETRQDAEFAVMTARNQKRFWRWGWIAGPAASLLQISDGASAWLGSFVVGTFVTGTLSWFFLRRARRAEELNLPRAQGMKAPTDDKPSRTQPQRPPRDGEPSPHMSQAKRRRRKR